jgi:hypothetical protein
MSVACRDPDPLLPAPTPLLLKNNVRWISHEDLQLLSVAPKPFERQGWLFELKYDGFRALGLKQASQTGLLSRQRNEPGTARLIKYGRP